MYIRHSLENSFSVLLLSHKILIFANETCGTMISRYFSRMDANKAAPITGETANVISAVW